VIARVLADIDDAFRRADALDTVVPATIGLIVVGWAVVVWVRARRRHDGHDPRT
jgi:hypothetical protein